MTRTTHRIAEGFALLAVTTAVAGAVLYGFAAPPEIPSAHRVAIVLDVSMTSSPDGRCEDVEAIAAGVAGSAGLEILLFATGDRSSADQPRLVHTLRSEGATRFLEGAAEEQEAIAHQVEGLVAACRGLEETRVSPVFTAVHGAAAQLAGAGCSAPHRCELWVRTDGLEEEDEAIVARLDGSERPTETRINNGEIAVTLCGLAARSVRPSARRYPGITEVRGAWSAEFSRPGTVRYAPACGPLAGAR